VTSPLHAEGSERRRALSVLALMCALWAGCGRPPAPSTTSLTQAVATAMANGVIAAWPIQILMNEWERTRSVKHGRPHFGIMGRD
jgi:hypothetical protein